MDPAHLAAEALTRLLALQKSGSFGTSEAPEQAQPLVDVFVHLGKLDGWAKIAIDRLAADPQDAVAAQELRRSLEQAARLHPRFIHRLVAALADRPSVRTSITLPQQPTPVPHRTRT